MTPREQAEREAHAAEVARLRAALDSHGQHHLSCAQSSLKPWKAKRNTCTCGLDDALAAPPTAAAQAVEGMRRALEYYANRNRWTSNGASEDFRRLRPRLMVPVVTEMEYGPGWEVAEAALAAYKEALRG